MRLDLAARSLRKTGVADPPADLHCHNTISNQNYHHINDYAYAVELCPGITMGAGVTMLRSSI